MLEIQDSPFWEKEDIPDIPLTEDQMIVFVKGSDGFYHVTEHYTTEKMKGGDLLREIIIHGHFQPRILDDRLINLFKEQDNHKTTT